MFLITIGIAGCNLFQPSPEELIPFDEFYELRTEFKFSKPQDNVEIYAIPWNEWLKVDVKSKDMYNPPLPDNENYIRFLDSQRVYQAIDKSYRVAIPHLSSKRVVLTHQVNRDQVTSQVLIADDNQWVVGIQSTKIHDDYPKDDKLLKTSLAQRRLNLEKLVTPDEIELKFFNFSNRIVLEDRHYGIKRDLYYFFSGFSYSRDGSVRVNRCIVRNEYYIEISVYIPPMENNEEIALEISDFLLADMNFPNTDKFK